MDYRILLKLFFFGMLFLNFDSSFAQVPVSESNVKKFELDENNSLTIKDLKRTNQGALMFKYDVEIVPEKGRKWIKCGNVSLTDLATKTVYHTMEGSGTSNGDQYLTNTTKVSCWAMITEPPVSVKTANLVVDNFAPILIDLPQ